ncbi:MAG: ATP-dependent metallopeptidase FtsH/Yme1/Tma family protein [Nitrospinae bacterium]|nr:ATP-dependent metallopeptidase FtsH/Yme1/Tma family protein [Nitrospinota bacterium]
MNQFYKNLALWLVIGLIMIALFNLFQQPKLQKSLVYSDFLNLVESGQIANVRIQGDNLSGILSGGAPFQTYAPKDLDLIRKLRDKNIRIDVAPADDTPWYMNLLISWFPMLLLLGIWIFFMRQMQAGGGKALSFGKSRAKLLKENNKTTFKDVAGVDEAKEELQEIIEFLKEPQKFQKLGGKIPKGVLLMGPPGTGKTLLARAVAGEANVPFFAISGSDFVEMFVGVGASRVRDLFDQGKKNAPCIIFVDEIDAVGRHRGAGLGGGHDEREQTLNALLVEMDGFESNEGVIIVAATNRPDVLDPALLRPGRFDRQVVVSTPDIRGREGIIKVHIQNIPLGKDVDIKVLARGTPGFSGADLANLVNEAALMAARYSKITVEMDDLENAKDKVLMGVERRSMVISDKEKKNTAVHEAGHALVAKLVPGTDPIHKVTIIPRGRALGLTQQLPIDEKHTYPKDFLLKNLLVLMGGRAAEEIALGQITTGAGNDIERATDLARKMVCEWGMSEAMGPLSYGKKEEQIFLGREIAQHKDYSESTAQQIDVEVKNLVMDSYEKTKAIVRDNLAALNRLTDALLDRETLDGEEVDEMVFNSTKKKKENVEKLKRDEGQERETKGAQEKDGGISSQEPLPGNE